MINLDVAWIHGGSHTSLRPLKPDERLPSLDLIRGVGVFGILIVNI